VLCWQCSFSLVAFHPCYSTSARRFIFTDVIFIFSNDGIYNDILYLLFCYCYMLTYVVCAHFSIKNSNKDYLISMAIYYFVHCVSDSGRFIEFELTWQPVIYWLGIITVNAILMWGHGKRRYWWWGLLCTLAHVVNPLTPTVAIWVQL